VDQLIFTINFLFAVYYFILIIRALLPWVPPERRVGLVRLIYALSGPLLSVIRLGLPPQRLGRDYSPYIAIVLVWVLQQIILRLL
jgi:uncharacterized protein YggT (Ycf19 family)